MNASDELIGVGQGIDTRQTNGELRFEQSQKRIDGFTAKQPLAEPVAKTRKKGTKIKGNKIICEEGIQRALKHIGRRYEDVLIHLKKINRSNPAKKWEREKIAELRNLQRPARGRPRKQRV